MKTFQFLLRALFSFIVLACSQQTEENKQITQAALSVELVDSIQFNMLANPILTDISPEANHVLFYDWASGSCLIFNIDGEPISVIENKKGLPDDPGFFVEMPAFFNDTCININGGRGFFLYNLGGENLTYLKNPEPSKMILMAYQGKGARRVPNIKDNVMLVKAFRDNNSYKGEEVYYEKYKALEVVNFTEGTIKNIIPFDSASMFKNGKAYIDSDFLPAFNTNKKHILIAHGADPRLFIYHYDAHFNLSLDSIIPLPVEEHYPMEGAEMKTVSKGTSSLNTTSTAVRDIQFTSSHILINYYSGFPDKMWDNLKGKEGDERSAAFQRIKDQYYEKILIFDKNDYSFLGQVELPSYVQRMGFVAKDSLIWGQKDLRKLDIEEDFVTLYRFRLQ